MEIADETDLRNQILQLIPSGVGVYDFTGGRIRKEYLNDGYFRMLDAVREDRSQYDGCETVNALFPADLPGLLAEVRACIAEKRMLRCRFRVLDGGGKYRWVAIRANHTPFGADTERFYAAYYDIDELMRTQQKLRENELLFNDLLTYSEILHFTYYPLQHRCEAQVRPQQLSELPPAMDDFPESCIRYARMSAADAEACRAMIRRIDAGEQEADCTVRACYLGKYSWYHIRLVNFLDSTGRPERAIGNAVVVDSFKEAEEKLQEERLRMQSLRSGILATSCFSVTRDRNIELNNDGHPHDVQPQDSALYAEAVALDPEISKQNPETLRVLLSAAEAIPDRQQRRDFLLTCSHAGMMRLYEAGRREVALEYRRRTGRGLLWVSTRIVLLPDPASGEILAFYYTTDINDRVLFRRISGRIMSQNYEAVAYCDLQTGTLYLRDPDEPNSIAFKGTPYAQAIDAAVREYVAPQDAEEARRRYELPAILADLEKSDMCTIYYTGRQQDESLPGKPPKRMKSDVFYLDDSRDILVFLQSNATAIFEQEREHREKLAAALRTSEQANTAKAEFISRISHDIRTPISIIRSMTDFAFADLHDEQKLRSDLEKIQSADTFLLSLINDVLDISKIDSGKIELDPQPYPYEEHNANIRNLLEPMCAEKGLHWSLERRRRTGVIVADRIRLNQITLNVLSNAVKYTPPGGTVTYISDSEDLPDGRIRFGFEVHDTGIGMSDAFQQRMFEPFAQEYDNPGRSKAMTGTGLGLAIVKKMVDLMGGTLQVHSALGKGTCVRVDIIFPDALRDPRWQSWSAQPAGAPLPAKEPLHGRVLLAEDNPINTEIAVRILADFGLSVDCAENGAEAVRLFAASAPGSYAAVLMDIQMPLLNGYEAAVRIRALARPDASVPILAMTADAFTDAMQRGYEAGMNEYIVKPLDPSRLHAALQKYLPPVKL